MPGVLRRRGSGEEVSQRNKSLFQLCALAVLAETVLIAVQQYGNPAVTAWDRFQMVLEELRAAPPTMALCVLILGSFWVWRKRKGPKPNTNERAGFIETS